MVHDRAMNLSVWLSSEGHAYAVQRSKPQLSRMPSSDESLPSSKGSTSPGTRLFDGYCFHKPTGEFNAVIASINARFSLIALATSSGRILCYAAKDYAGNIPLSHEITTTMSASTTGNITSLAWSPDGYCLFVGYERGWTTWSVFGKEGASTFRQNASHADSNREDWLLATHRAAWASGGAEILLSTPTSNRIWKLEMSRSAAMGCFSCANLVRALLQTPTELSLYRGHELPDLTSISNKASLWHHAQYPAAYLNNQWPIKSCVVSQDGRYVAVAGRRGLAHYSVQSGRWKTFADPAVENSFAVRGGMCWFGHILTVATEHVGGYDLRLYSRELDLGRFPLHVEPFSTPIVFVGPSGEDSVLVYTYENVLYHYIINITERSAEMVQVGQIAFQGIVRAPSRVRSVSWVVPEFQLRNGDPSRDVEFASVLFLVDDKLVLLQSTRNEEDELKYEMRVIAQHVEYYILMRDQIYLNFASIVEESAPPTPSPGSAFNTRSQQNYSLRDSLWIFGGDQLRLWPDVRELFHHGACDQSIQPPLTMPVDFYPLSILLTKGIVLGIESELLQRRGVSFAQFNSSIRTQLFLPYVLRHHLCEVQDTTAAFGLANQYQNLSYFAHALEILLHHVLDDEVDRKGSKSDDDAPEPLPAVLSFLQLVLPLTTYLATVVQCIRKTELTSWRTLFQHLPPPLTLFEQALELEDLKTASGYLIVLQGLEEGNDESNTYDARRFESYVIRLMTLAREKGDFELCAELARFMMGIDPRGGALRRVIAGVGFEERSAHLDPSRSVSGAAKTLQFPLRGKTENQSPGEGRTSTEQEKPGSVAGADYFSASPGGY
jgi:RAB6A-GEF complex partner protein 1